MKQIRRGDIFYINNGGKPAVGSEQRRGRPAIVVSNNANNKHSRVVEVVYLTTSQQKHTLPTHVQINGTKIQSTALCEQVHSVSIDLLGNYFGRCANAEMRKVDHALGISLGLIRREEWKESDGDAEKLDQAV